jgi:hypothetical protein
MNCHSALENSDQRFHDIQSQACAFASSLKLVAASKEQLKYLSAL